eukprot:6264100-Amphidinium_carterae.2
MLDTWHAVAHDSVEHELLYIGGSNKHCMRIYGLEVICRLTVSQELLKPCGPSTECIENEQAHRVNGVSECTKDCDLFASMTVVSFNALSLAERSDSTQHVRDEEPGSELGNDGGGSNKNSKSKTGNFGGKPRAPGVNQVGKLVILDKLLLGKDVTIACVQESRISVYDSG